MSAEIGDWLRRQILAPPLGVKLAARCLSPFSTPLVRRSSGPKTSRSSNPAPLLRFICPTCQQLLGISSRKIRAQVKCPKCRTSLIVPHPDEGSAEAQGPDSPAADEVWPMSPRSTSHRPPRWQNPRRVLAA